MMFTKQLLKRNFGVAVSPKFPEGTVAGLYKRAVAENFNIDAVRFGAQKFNWTLKEFDKFSSAFAFGLVESGYAKGDKLMLWADQTNSAEILVAQMGAFKAGVTIVTFDEKDNQDAFHQALKDSGAKGLLFSPSTQISQDNEGHSVTRETYLKKLMPELHSLYPGDELSLNNYPYLKQIIQVGHHSIRGVIKFKDAMVYANPRISLVQIPENSSNDQAYLSYKNGKEVSSFTNGELAKAANDLWRNTFSGNTGNKPVFMSVNLETPLGFASFLANNANFSKVYIPSTFNMNKILEGIHNQQSELLVCDQEFYELEAPENKLQTFQELTGSVKKSLVASSSGKSGRSQLFKGDATTVDPYRL